MSNHILYILIAQLLEGADGIVMMKINAFFFYI